MSWGGGGITPAQDVEGHLCTHRSGIRAGHITINQHGCNASSSQMLMIWELGISINFHSAIRVWTTKHVHRLPVLTHKKVVTQEKSTWFVVSWWTKYCPWTAYFTVLCLFRPSRIILMVHNCQLFKIYWWWGRQVAPLRFPFVLLSAAPSSARVYQYKVI